MKIRITFERPYFEEATILALTSHDLDDFYVEANEVDRLNLFFMLEASLHRFQRENRRKAAARCAFLMAYYLFVPLTPPASSELARFYRPGAGMGGYAGVPPVEKTDRRRKLKLI